jgi:hypothetical protein
MFVLSAVAWSSIVTPRGMGELEDDSGHYVYSHIRRRPFEESDDETWDEVSPEQAEGNQPAEEILRDLTND